MNNNLTKSIKTGFLYTALGKYGNMIIQLIINAILSRLLTPNDYGVVAVVTVFIVFFQMLADMGIGPAIIQSKSLDKKDIESLFTLSIVLSFILGIFFFIFGFGIAWFYNNSMYISISSYLSISVFFYSLIIVPNAVLLKNQQFKFVSMAKLIASIIAGLVGITAAYNGFGVYALVVNNIANALVSFLLLFVFSRVKATKKINKQAYLKIRYFSKNQFGFNFINYFSRNMDNILIGKFISEQALGNYSKAYQLLMYPNSLLAGVITPVLQPVLSNHENDVEVIKEVYSKVIRVLALIGLPLSVFLSMNAKYIIYFMFGNQWGGAVTTFSILSTTVWIQMLLSSTGAIFQSRNKTNYLFFGGSVSACILVGAIILGIFTQDIEKLSIILVCGFVLNFVFSFWLLTNKALETNLLYVLKELKNPFKLSLLLIVVFYLFNMTQFNNSVFVELIIRSLVFGLTFLLGAYFMGEITVLKKILIEKRR